MRESDVLPLDPALLCPAMLVADDVMKPPVTRFLQEAQRTGCRVQLGEMMVLHQLGASVQFFLRTQAIPA